MKELSHLDASGRARMVDVGDKPDTLRTARAEGFISMTSDTLAVIATGALTKGDVLAAAQIAGIMAAKRTAELIPLCHPLTLHDVGVEIEEDRTLPGLRVTGWASVYGKTGAEMEALTATAVALLTIYDMAKSVERGMEISGVRLTAKSGGKSGDWKRE
ncbi:MAG TPA: cyclic pyranopterin monophosphate synthase MoaC [Gemmatimonadaceae bacterium]|nr:cyclic pyranopterin monophosphate synthase MoaC [Gemmatimonadaceae bacterium]